MLKMCKKYEPSMFLYDKWNIYKVDYVTVNSCKAVNITDDDLREFSFKTNSILRDKFDSYEILFII
jgi:hypothetical protein